MSKKVVLRVHLADDSFKTLALDPHISCKDLKAIMSEKLDLRNHRYFGLFHVRSDGLEHCLEDDEKPVHLVAGKEATTDETLYNKERWEFVRKAWDEHSKFVFKKRLFLKEDQSDQQAIHLEYIQAVADVISGRYPASAVHAVQLAGHQMQINFGDYVAYVHTSGFLKDKIQNYIPAPILKSKKVEEWERDIYSIHAQYSGRTVLDMKKEYLDFVRKWYFYGSTFFEVSNLSNKTIPPKICLAVNAEGIHLLKATTKELISSHAFPEIERWAFTTNSFAFMSGGTQKEKFQFETVQGGEAARLLQAYVDALLAMYQEETGDGDE